MTQLGYILFGWCLGLLSPAIVERIRRHYRNTELMNAILSELHELQYRMTLLCFLMRKRVANMPDDWLAWFESIVRNYCGPEPQANILETAVALRSLSEEKRRGMLLSEPRAESSMVKEFSMPLLMTHIADVSTFPIPFQRAVLRVKTQLDFYNQHVKYLQDQFAVTFTSEGRNHDIAVSNIESGYQYVGELAKRIADAIAHIPIPKT